MSQLQELPQPNKLDAKRLSITFHSQLRHAQPTVDVHQLTSQLPLMATGDGWTKMVQTAMTATNGTQANAQIPTLVLQIAHLREYQLVTGLVPMEASPMETHSTSTLLPKEPTPRTLDLVPTFLIMITSTTCSTSKIKNSLSKLMFLSFHVV